MLAAKPPNFSQPEARHAPGSSAGLCCESFSPHSAAIPIVVESGLVAESEEVGDSSTESAEPLPLFDECDANEDGTELDRGCRDGVPPARGSAGPAGEDEIASVLLFGEWACCCRVLPETRSGRDDGGVDIRATAAGPAPSRVDMTSESAGTSLGEWCETAANKLPGGKPQPVAACTSAAFFCSFSVALFCMSSTVLVQLLTPPDQGKPLAPSAPAPDAKRSMAPSPTCHGHFRLCSQRTELTERRQASQKGSHATKLWREGAPTAPRSRQIIPGQPTASACPQHFLTRLRLHCGRAQQLPKSLDSRTGGATPNQAMHWQASVFQQHRAQWCHCGVGGGAGPFSCCAFAVAVVCLSEFFSRETIRTRLRTPGWAAASYQSTISVFMVRR